MKYKYVFSLVDEGELSQIAMGNQVNKSVEWRTALEKISFPPGHILVISREDSEDKFVQPVAMVVRDEEHQRLFGRFAQLRSDLSPITAWCHFLSPELLSRIDPPARNADLGGWEAAWTGLAISEALLLSDRSLARVRLPACLATQSFALARTTALWGRLPPRETLSRLDLACRILRSSESTAVKLRPALDTIWSTLVSLSTESGQIKNRDVTYFVDALRELRAARYSGREAEAAALLGPLLHLVPEARALSDISSMSPEQRVQYFDHITALIEKEHEPQSPRRSALALVAGYVSTVAAGGGPSLQLTASLAGRAPDVTAWAYVLGSVGERVVWTSSFDGLGRLVARELLRSFRLDEPPMCDFAIEEAIAVADPVLADPLVHLRIKQSRVVTVALLPGVNVSIPFSDSPGIDLRKADDHRKQNVKSKSTVNRDESYETLADALWPYVRERLESTVEQLLSELVDGSGKVRKKGPQKKLWER